MRRILPPTPLDLVNLLFYLKGFKIVKFWLMGLEFGVELVFAGFLLVNSQHLGGS
jgi:hypothetical protein